MPMLWKLKQRQQKWLAQEKGTIIKDWGGKLAIALAFPNRYAVGMSNLGFQSVYGALNRSDDVVCERVFYPEPEDLSILRRDPGSLLSVESQRPVRDFSLLFFSIPFENDYTNVLEILALSGVPHGSDERREGHPFVAAGGVAVSLNPEPLAAFMDFLFIGEAEELLSGFLNLWRGFSDKLFPARGDALLSLAREGEGIYVPSLYEVAYRPDGTLQSIEPLHAGVPEKVAYRRADISKEVPCQTVVLAPETEFSGVRLIEIGRGCGHGCRFCAAGYLYRPARFHTADKLVEAVGSAPGASARVGLISAAVSDHPDISLLCSSLVDRGASVSFSSLRADTMTPEIAAALQSSGHQAVAIAPEAGSDRLRRVINKRLSEEEILRAAELLSEHGILHLKLYFMIGLPTEAMEDLEAIVDLTRKIKHHVLKTSRGLKRLGVITLSVHSFVPKPITPFQWASFAGARTLKERAKWIQKSLQKVPNVRIHFDMPKWAYVQALLSRGDRRVGGFLEKVATDGLSWTQVMRSVPYNPDFWVMRERGEDELFPWEIIDPGVRRSYLWNEYQRALRAEESPVCLPDENCRRCGVCGTGDCE
jgi:radical SAM superfamily enzyme YgiQ (UPF0313 family)